MIMAKLAYSKSKGVKSEQKKPVARRDMSEQKQKNNDLSSALKKRSKQKLAR